MPKITVKDKKPGNSAKGERLQITANTGALSRKDEGFKSYQWWKAKEDKDLAEQLVSTANYLQKTQQYRIKQASIFSRIYNGKPLMNYALNSKVLDTSNQLPMNRPTLNVVQSCVDTLVSRITQSRPRPVFLTDGGSYKERTLSKQLNNFIAGEFYRCKAYEVGEDNLRDAGALGDGFVKVYENNGRVAIERVLETELYVDKNDAFYGKPRQLIQVKIIDRDVAMATWPEADKAISKAMKAVVDASSESTETVSDQIIVVEGWHLESAEGAGDGRHTIACSHGVIFDDQEWCKTTFPFVKIGYTKPVVGYFYQGLSEMLMGTQIEINKLLITMSQAIGLIGVPRIFIDEVSKVLETAFNNNIGTIIKYRGTKPIYEVAPCVPQEMYDHLQRLINYAYQQSGISNLSAGGQKPAGLNSGEAIRTFDDLQTDRFASLEKKYEQYYIDLAYLMIDQAKDIAERDGKYTTVYPGKDGTREVDLPKAAILKDNYIIQCFDESSLPRDPAGRQARLSEMLASGEISLQEYRRLRGFPDLEQSDKLANALEERILQLLDQIVEGGKYIAPDPFLLDPTNLGATLSTQYINLYAGQKLEEEKMQRLRNWNASYLDLVQKAQPPAPPVQQQPNQGVQNPAPVPPAAPMSPTSQAA